MSDHRWSDDQRRSQVCTIDSKLSQFGVQGGAPKSETSGSTVRTRNHSTHLSENLEDVLALDGFECGLTSQLSFRCGPELTQGHMEDVTFTASLALQRVRLCRAAIVSG